MGADVAEIIKKLGMFMIIAQTVLHFRAKESYEKYISALIGVMTITLCALPILGLVNKDMAAEFKQGQAIYEDMMREIHTDMVEEETLDLVELTEREIKTRVKDWLIDYGYSGAEVDISIRGIESVGDKAGAYIIIVKIKEKSVRTEIGIDKIVVGESERESRQSPDEVRKGISDMLGVDYSNVEVLIYG